MTTRLESISLLIANKFRSANVTLQRHAIIKVCKLAITETNLVNQDIDIAISLLSKDECNELGLSYRIDEIASKFDEDYLLLAESGSDSEDKNTLIAFSKARVASAIALAISENSTNYEEAIYEAILACKNQEQALAVVETNVDGLSKA